MFGPDQCVMSISNQVRVLEARARTYRSSGQSCIQMKDDIFSIGRKNVTSMLINDDKLIVACSDGNIRLFDLGMVATFDIFMLSNSHQLRYINYCTLYQYECSHQKTISDRLLNPLKLIK